MTAEPAQSFARRRDFAAWLGLTPLQRSTGGKQRLGKTSKMGERTLRRCLIIGASAVVPRRVSGRLMRAVDPSEIPLRTEKVTPVLEGIGNGKIRWGVSPWEDAKVILAEEVLEGVYQRPSLRRTPYSA